MATPEEFGEQTRTGISGGADESDFHDAILRVSDRN
jgi:hypothetical protein